MRRPNLERIRRHYNTVIAGLIVTETTILTWLHFRTGAPLLLWLESPAVRTPMMLGIMVTTMLYACGETEDAKRSGLAFAAFTLAVAIAQVPAVARVVE